MCTVAIWYILFIHAGFVLTKGWNSHGIKAHRPSSLQKVNGPKVHKFPRARTRHGVITGKYSDDQTVEEYYGIPYASPPKGSLRFEPPQSYRGGLEGYEAFNHGPSCYGTGKSGKQSSGLPVSEDCLQLNVVRPAGFLNNKLPVAIWIHGGDFMLGTAGRDVHNLTTHPVRQSIAAGTPLIIVSINYRLSGFGFSASRDMKRRNGLNLGLQDQRMAMKWVKDNISGFGGDPNSVALWGHSAGAISIGLHMLANGGKNEKLFHRVVMQSGAATSIAYPTYQDMEARWRSVSTEVGCSRSHEAFECMKRVSAEELVDAFEPLELGPILDGKVLADRPSVQLNRGDFVRVPTLIGTTMDEGTAAASRMAPINSTTQLFANIKQNILGLSNVMVRSLLTYYPESPKFGSPFGTGDQFGHDPKLGYQYKRSSAISGDFAFIGPRRSTCEMVAARGVPVYSYNWNQSAYDAPPYMGAAHSSDLPYAFHNMDAKPIGPDPDGHKAELAELYSRYLVAFMATGDPNSAKFDRAKPGPFWEKYTLNNRINHYFSAKKSWMEQDTWRRASIAFLNYGLDNQVNR